MLTLTEAQIETMKGSEVTVTGLEVYWRLYPELNFDAAVGGAVMLVKGQGQVRTERLEIPGEYSADFKAATAGTVVDAPVVDLPVGEATEQTATE